jgi:hypothetical protein
MGKWTLATRGDAKIFDTMVIADSVLMSQMLHMLAHAEREKTGKKSNRKLYPVRAVRQKKRRCFSY